MNIFSKKPDNLTKQLSQSAQNFSFDQEKVKNRLMYSLNDAPIKAPAKIFFRTRILKYSSVLAAFVIFVSATFAFASSSEPGDKLFPLNKIGEKVILSLPLSAQQKASIQTGIVNKRLKSLETVKVRTEDKQLETVKESDESLQNAIEAVSANKKRLEASGHTQGAEKLGQVLNRLDALAEKHEQQFQSIEELISDNEGKQTVRKHLREIKNARRKAHIELKLLDTEIEKN
jgi:hypothetical protein